MAPAGPDRGDILQRLRAGLVGGGGGERPLQDAQVDEDAGHQGVIILQAGRARGRHRAEPRRGQIVQARTPVGQQDGADQARQVMVAATRAVTPAKQDAADSVNGRIDRLLTEHLDGDGVADHGVDGREDVDITEHIADDVDLMAVVPQPMGEALRPLVVEQIDPVGAAPSPEGAPAVIHLAQEEIDHLAPDRRQGAGEIERIGEGAHEPFQRRT